MLCERHPEWTIFGRRTEVAPSGDDPSNANWHLGIWLLIAAEDDARWCSVSRKRETGTINNLLQGYRGEKLFDDRFPNVPLREGIRDDETDFSFGAKQVKT